MQDIEDRCLKTWRTPARRGFGGGERAGLDPRSRRPRGPRRPQPAAVLDDPLVVTDDALLVSEESISAGMRLLFEHAGLAVEPSGALGIAALLENRERFAGRHVVTIACGSNVDMEDHRRWVGA